MRILFLSAYYMPETVADTHLEQDLLATLIKENCSITVICPIPSRGVSEEVRRDYKRRKEETQFGGKLIIRRFWAPKERKNAILRAVRYIWCNFRSYRIGRKQSGIDAIYCNSTPPTQGLVAASLKKYLSKKSEVKFIFNIQDLFPDSLANSGLGKMDGFWWKIGTRISNKIYEEADEIISVTRRIKDNLIKKGVKGEKIHVVSNWIDLCDIHPVNRENNLLITEFGIDPKKFIVLYAGNIGPAQGADFILQVAKKMESIESIHFVIFGGGVCFEDVRKSARALPNVFVHPLLPLDRVSDVYSLADLAVIICKPRTGDSAMPSKLWSIMACNRRIVASFDLDSELADVINEAHAGVCVEPGNVELFCEAIRQYYEEYSNNNFKPVNLRDYVAANADKKYCVQKYIEVIKTNNGNGFQK